jgi:FG-GAP-like repeat
MRLLVLTVLVLAGGDAAVQTPTFLPPVQVAALSVAPANFQEVGAADLNGDGNVDVIVTRIDFEDPKPTQVTILVGDGKGHFSDRTKALFDGPIAAPVFPRRTVFGDFNGDGRTDVFIADTGRDAAPFPGWPNTLILSAPGGKLIDASTNLPRDPDFTHCASVGDVDRNGTLDIYAGNLGGSGNAGRPEILLNDGTGHFRVSANALPADMTTAAYIPHYDGCGFADVTGDGAPDLVLAGTAGVPDRLLLDDGAGHYTDSPVALPPKPWGTDNSEGLDVTPLDVNADGHIDLLLGFTKNVPFYKGHWIQVLINRGDGSFADETAVRLPQSDNDGEWPYTIQIADLNNDGEPDLGLSLWWYPPDIPLFWLNQGDGTFKQILGTTLASTEPGFVFLDANNDHRVDLYGVHASFNETHFLTLQTVDGTTETAVATVVSVAVRRLRATVRWRGNAAASTFDLALRRSGASWKTVVTRDPGRTYTVSAARGTRYAVRVRGRNASGAPGPWSASRTFRIP